MRRVPGRIRINRSLPDFATLTATSLTATFAAPAGPGQRRRPAKASDDPARVTTLETGTVRHMTDHLAGRYTGYAS